MMLAAGAGVVFAQGEDPTPPGTGTGCSIPRNLGDGRAPRGPRGERPIPDGDRGKLHALMLSAFADALGISAAELESRLEAERGLMAIALAQGLSPEEARALLEEARAEAVQEAVEQGLIDEDMAQRLLEHPEPGMRGLVGPCPMHGGRGSFGPYGSD